jgi:hypothetical protein
VTIVEVKIRHDYKWGCDNFISSYYNLGKKNVWGYHKLGEVCMGL